MKPAAINFGILKNDASFKKKTFNLPVRKNRIKTIASSSILNVLYHKLRKEQFFIKKFIPQFP
ncbi:hypothetical protein BpHYR1_008975 [Brachionus plicatilis]|uniref:Uncharacterized protein n=1 Tax=Brachionus plicatilis TaxID=10195 RepID=A0A3M7QLR6_BRAPC|nr:hypothetical protein BpHYR1_008975 [Brachionus plicatilis]